jgi:hypothetical protein
MGFALFWALLSTRQHSWCSRSRLQAPFPTIDTMATARKLTPKTPVPSDITIAQSIEPLHIAEIAKAAGILEVRTIILRFSTNDL